ncbi:hypothetical protein XENORESO_011557 [Xenotaenia resolanae]|uniref:Polyadenylate-binding protein-interacting protein 2 n=1 Tax=Xenotaenia resolanae TaxID=208358 RepID=A0ABV0WGP2_9TELE
MFMCLQVEEELWEEEFIEHCFQEMLDEEDQWEWFIPSRDLAPGSVSQLQEQIGLLVLDPDMYAEASDLEVVMRSSLNPNAKEFTPGHIVVKLFHHHFVSKKKVQQAAGLSPPEEGATELCYHQFGACVNTGSRSAVFRLDCRCRPSCHIQSGGGCCSIIMHGLSQSVSATSRRQQNARPVELKRDSDSSIRNPRKKVTQSCLELIAQRGDVGECAAATDVCKETAGHDPCVPSPSPLDLIITFTTTMIIDRIRGWASCMQPHCSSEDSRRTCQNDCMTNHVPDRSASTSLPSTPASSLSSTTPPDDSFISLKEESFHSFVESRLTTPFLLNYSFVAAGSSYCSPNHMASSLSSTSEPHSAAETRLFRTVYSFPSLSSDGKQLKLFNVQLAG